MPEVESSKKCASSTLLPMAMAKNLGTAASCGTKRSTVFNKKRHKASVPVADKTAELSQWGVSRYLAARLAVVTKQTWGLEQQGVADYMLQIMRSSTLRGVAARAMGRSVELAYFLLDSTSGTLDPAFHAHVLPIYHWALAVYLDWFPQDSGKNQTPLYV